MTGKVGGGDSPGDITAQPAPDNTVSWCPDDEAGR